MTAGGEPERVADGAVAAGLGPVLEAGGEALEAALVRTERRLAEVADGHGEQLGRLARATLAAGGKRLRPTLVFLCAGSHIAEDTVRGAVAVELLHMATLVHDDVLDRAELRRGRPTVYAEAGRRAATAAGDLLFSRAFGELALTGSSVAIKTLSRASSALARGELMQREDAWSASVSEERYLARCELKTARLFEASCRLGALLGASSSAEDALGGFGARIGLAFQILDDVLDVEGPAERTGKHRGTDLLDGTVTLPLIIARRLDPRIARADLRTEVTDARSAERLCERIAATGALGEARRLALGHVAEAKAALAEAELPAGSARALDLVADGVVGRYA